MPTGRWLQGSQPARGNRLSVAIFFRLGDPNGQDFRL
jgi:hypothetical protein